MVGAYLLANQAQEYILEDGPSISLRGLTSGLLTFTTYDSEILDVFHVSMLKRYVKDFDCVIGRSVL